MVVIASTVFIQYTLYDPGANVIDVWSGSWLNLTNPLWIPSSIAKFIASTEAVAFPAPAA